MELSPPKKGESQEGTRLFYWITHFFLFLITEEKLLWSARSAWASVWLTIVGIAAVVTGLIAIVGAVAVVGMVAVIAGMRTISPLVAGASAGCGGMTRRRSPVSYRSVVVAVAVVAFSTCISTPSE